MVKRSVAIIVLIAVTCGVAQTIPSLPPLPSDLSEICFSDSSIVPYYEILLDSLKAMDTTGLLSAASVKASCDSLSVVIPVFGTLEIPVFTVWKMNACSIGVFIADPSSGTGMRDSVVDVCAQLPIKRQAQIGSYQSGTGLTVTTLAENQFSIYLDADMIGAQIMITTVDGRLIYSQSVRGGESIIWNGRGRQSSSTVPAGLYVCTAETSAGTMRSIAFLKK